MQYNFIKLQLFLIYFIDFLLNLNYKIINVPQATIIYIITMLYIF